ncbi:MAG: hypothetical protein ABSC94_23420 [Polyangiaceae bacterium]
MNLDEVRAAVLLSSAKSFAQRRPGDDSAPGLDEKHEQVVLARREGDRVAVKLHNAVKTIEIERSPPKMGVGSRGPRRGAEPGGQLERIERHCDKVVRTGVEQGPPFGEIGADDQNRAGVSLFSQPPALLDPLLEGASGTDGNGVKGFDRLVRLRCEGPGKGNLQPGLFEERDQESGLGAAVIGEQHAHGPRAAYKCRTNR